MVYKHERVQAIRAMRGKMWSPGRPSTARRENRVRFWEGIAAGLSTENAAIEAGISPAVGARWFRDAGGMPPLELAPVSGRYLSFAEREEIAILHVQHVGVREIARRLGRSPSTISRELRRNVSTRSSELTYIGHRRHSGTPIGVPAARRSPSLQGTTGFVSMSRTGLRGPLPGLTARRCPVPM